MNKCKKIIACILIASLCVSLAACGAKKAETTDSTQKTHTEDEEATVRETEAWSSIDVDLTALSSTMVYSEVYSMVSSPEKYVGKVVKMKGQFAVYINETTGRYYYAVIIADAIDCCHQGIEFIWTGDHSYPQDFPEVDKEIEITGVFQTYLENGQTYFHLIADDLVVC